MTTTTPDLTDPTALQVDLESLLKVQVHAEPALDCGTDPLQRLPEPSPSPAPSTALALPYSHTAMVELMVAQPGWGNKKLAAHFGKGAGWFASVLASDSFQLELDKRRGEIANPALTATMDERFRALALRSLDVLQDKLDSKDVSDNIVLRAAEIGVKALGMGQGVPQAQAPQVGSVDSLAERLIAAFDKQRGNVRKPVTVESDITDATVVVPSTNLKEL